MSYQGPPSWQVPPPGGWPQQQQQPSWQGQPQQQPPQWKPPSKNPLAVIGAVAGLVVLAGACMYFDQPRPAPAATEAAQAAPVPQYVPPPMQPALSPGGMVPINPPSGAAYRDTSGIAAEVRASLARDWCPNPRRMNRCPDWYVMFATGDDRLTITSGASGLSAHVYTMIPQADADGRRIALQICQHVTIALARHGQSVVRVYREGGRITANSVFGRCTNGIF